MIHVILVSVNDVGISFLVKNETVLCTPDGMKSVGKHGQCVNTIDLNDKCSDTEISASEDHCAKFDGHWCCYGKYGRPSASGLND